MPNGGWLDGCLGLLAGLEVLRALADDGRPPVTVRLVDWADEEGARFGRSLFGSSAVSGSLNIEEARRLRDHEGMSLPTALASRGIDLDKVLEAGGELDHAVAYVELHIEQGPSLEQAGLAMGTVVGTVGVERHMLRFRGQAAHSGATPMHLRRDAFLAAAKMAQEIMRLQPVTRGSARSGTEASPGVPTSVVGESQTGRTSDTWMRTS